MSELKAVAAFPLVVTVIIIAITIIVAVVVVVVVVVVVIVGVTAAKIVIAMTRVIEMPPRFYTPPLPVFSYPLPPPTQRTSSFAVARTTTTE